MATNDGLNNSLSGQTGTGSYAGSDSPVFTTQIEVPQVSSPTATDLVLDIASGQTLDINITGGGGFDTTITGAGNFAVNLGTGKFVLDGTTGVDGIIDDDTMATASATTLATSESIKAYVDNTIRVAATQAEMEAASSTSVYVSPGRQQYHPSAAKAWVKFNGTGTVAINASYNTTSATDRDWET